MTLDLDRIRRDANTAGKYVDDSIGTRVLKRDVPALCDEVERLRRWQPVIDQARKLAHAEDDPEEPA